MAVWLWLLLVLVSEMEKRGTSLVVQWIRIRLSMQRSWVRSLVREDATCHRATKPVCHKY